jgi:hypothetical protein
VVFQWCFSGVTVVLQWCHSGVTEVLAISMVLEVWKAAGFFTIS